MTQYDDMLIDVDAMDFVNDDKVDDTSIEFDKNTSSNVETYVDDSQTGEIVMKLTSKDDLPLKNDQTGNNAKAHLKFKLGPCATNNIAFITGANQSKIFPVKLPRVDTTNEYFNYILKLYEIYDSLGEHKTFCIPTMGLINSDFIKEHSQIVNLALDTLVGELEILIDSIKDQESLLPRYLELEDTLTILNCLRLTYFTNEKINEIDNRPLFLERLINWVNRSDGQPNDEYVESIFSENTGNSKIFQMGQFWKLINKLLNRGLFTQAIGCLERSGILNHLAETSETALNVVKDFIELIKQYPMDSMNIFREWKNLTLELLETFAASGDMEIDFELKEFIQDSLQLISGNKDKILQYSDTWCESISGLMLFYIPSYELLNEYLELSIRANPINITNIWEKNCLDILNGNIHMILPDLESLDTCTASFIACLVEAKGLLENFSFNKMDEMEEDSDVEEENENKSIASYMLLNFAFELSTFENKKLWPICIGLISKIPNLTNRKRKMIIADLLLHYPFKTNDDIEWMFSVCAEWKLSDVSRSIYTMLGSTMLNEGKTIEAMSNYSKAGKFQLLKDYSWILLEASLINKGPLDDEILNAIVSNNRQIAPDIIENLVTDSMRQVLSPYAVLYQYYHLKSMGENDKAFQILIELITFPYLPQRQLVLLISEILYPILIDKEMNAKISIRDDDIIKIMECVELKLDIDDLQCKELYDKIISNKKNEQMDQDETEFILPNNLAELNQGLRNQLSIKLCQEFV